MIHPSYVELMKVVNHDVVIGEEPVVNSRYSIVCATAKRARQIIDGSVPVLPNEEGNKPLSIAVDELNSGNLRILTEEEAKEGDARLKELREKKAAADAKRNEEEKRLAKEKALLAEEDEDDFSDETEAEDDEE